jgi:hypothetical protein
MKQQQQEMMQHAQVEQKLQESSQKSISYSEHTTARK